MDRTFVNAQKKAYEHSQTFDAPTDEDFIQIQVGHYVKICAADVERFWVKIEEIKGNTLTGTIKNDLVKTHIHGYKDEDKVQFKYENIYQIYYD